MKQEIWKTIEGYENYEISNLGRVKSLGNNKTRKEKILKPVKDRKGYLVVSLCQNGSMKTCKIHRLVAQAFIPNPENKPQVNHKNEIKTDNRAENLEYCTAKENLNYGTHNERVAKALKGRKQSQEHIEKRVKAKKGRKLSQEHIEKLSIAIVQMDLQGNFIAVHQSSRQIERDLGFDNGYIIKCCKGKLKTAYKFKWEYLSEWEKRKAI